MKRPKEYTYAEIASKIDHTLLNPVAGPDDINRLCDEAVKHGFASVCIHPWLVKEAAARLAGSGVAVCTVVGFPLGMDIAASKTVAAIGAIKDGAKELDVVMNVGRFKFREHEEFAELATLVQFAREAGKDVVLKLIIECCKLTDREKRAACRMAVKAGFDFVKTSTGFAEGGATVEDVRLMRKAVGRKALVKAAGGIRTREDAVAMLNAGADRLGCSAGVAIVS